MYDVERRGYYLSLDDRGVVQRRVSPATIQEGWRPAIDAATDACRVHLGERLHSVYVAGSVAAGYAIPGISDLDIGVVTKNPLEESERAWADRESVEICRKHQFVGSVHFIWTTAEQLAHMSQLRIMLQLYGVCVHGADVVARLAGVRLGRETALQCETIRDEICDGLLSIDSLLDVRSRCGNVMKRILRAGFELVMLREQRYTMDVPLCFESVVKHYPERAGLLSDVFRYSRFPTSDPNVVRMVLARALTWLPAEVERVWGADIHRERAGEDEDSKAVRTRSNTSRHAPGRV
jgi:uncharacterized protein